MSSGGTNILRTPVPTPVVDTSSTAVYFGAAHTNAYVVLTGTATTSLYINPDATYDFPVGTNIAITKVSSAGSHTVVPISGVTLLSKDNLRELDGEMATATLIKVGANTWHLMGMLK